MDRKQYTEQPLGLRKESNHNGQSEIKFTKGIGSTGIPHGQQECESNRSCDVRWKR